MASDRSASRRLRVLFMGTPALAVPTLEAVAGRHEVVAVVTQPDRAAGRGRRVVASPVKTWAVDAGVPVLQPQRVREAEATTMLAATRPEVAVVVAFGQILPPEILELPVLGCINLHASLLPRHRGASPIQAAILAGDAVTGVTTMLMDEGLDTGPTLQRDEVSIAANDTAGTLGNKLAVAGASLVLTTLQGLADGTLIPRPQDPAAATMTRLIAKTDGRIDWTRDAAAIDRRVRAMQPWPVAYTDHDGERFKVWEVAGVTASAAGHAPGTVIASGDELVVACGDGERLRVVEIQRAGGRRMLAADLLRGRPLPVGSVLGSGS